MNAVRQFIVYDTETTGLYTIAKNALDVPASITMRGGEVCQIGGLVLNEAMVPKKLFCHYCDTVVAESSSSAFSVHGISQREVRGRVLAQFLPEILTYYLPEFFGEDVVFLGYNIEFDMSMVAQTMANTPLPFTWTPFKGSILPKHGRVSVNVADYVKQGTHYRKLSTFDEELKERREDFIRRMSNVLSIETNCCDMLNTSWRTSHNAFYDALNTYLLWGDRVWKKKLL